MPGNQHRIGGIGPGETGGELFIEMEARAKGTCAPGTGIVHWLGVDGGVRRPSLNQSLERSRLWVGPNAGGRYHSIWADQVTIELELPAPDSLNVRLGAVDGGPVASWLCTTTDGKTIACQ